MLKLISMKYKYIEEEVGMNLTIFQSGTSLLGTIMVENNKNCTSLASSLLLFLFKRLGFQVKNKFYFFQYFLCYLLYCCACMSALPMLWASQIYVARRNLDVLTLRAQYAR